MVLLRNNCIIHQGQVNVSARYSEENFKLWRIKATAEAVAYFVSESIEVAEWHRRDRVNYSAIFAFSCSDAGIKGRRS